MSKPSGNPFEQMWLFHVQNLVKTERQYAQDLDSLQVSRIAIVYWRSLILRDLDRNTRKR